MSPTVRIFGALISGNFQIALVITLLFLSHDYFEQNYPLGVDWGYILFGVGLGVTIHTYYIMIRYVLKVDRLERERKGGGGDDR